MTKAEVIAEIQKIYDPDGLDTKNVREAKELIQDIANHRNEIVDLSKWRSLLKAFLKDLLALCQQVDAWEKRAAARKAEGIKWANR